jgi:hypothetical protein
MKKIVVLLIFILMISIGFFSGCNEQTENNKLVGTWIDQHDREWIFEDNGKLLWFGYINAFFKIENNQLYISEESTFPTNQTEIWSYDFFNENRLSLESTAGGATYTLKRE